MQLSKNTFFKDQDSNEIREKAKESHEQDHFSWDGFPHYNPVSAWKYLKKYEKSFYPIPYIVETPSKTPRPSNCLRFVCISDTHGYHYDIPGGIPSGDVLLFAGDFSCNSLKEEIDSFCNFLDLLPFKYKIVISGNHDIVFDVDFYNQFWKEFKHPSKLSTSDEILELKRHCTYLHDQGCSVEGINIYGSPYQVWFCQWAFGLERGSECRKKWESIPLGTDILITHGAPMGRMDISRDKRHNGDADLLEIVREKIKPKIHVFGHFHDNNGVSYDGQTVFINASILTDKYNPKYSAIVFDFPVSTKIEESCIDSKHFDEKEMPQSSKS
ncbi:putative metallophosphoesterase domain-containing protein 1 [Monocercomonoides exilis]|uniref:putative metallophosphoesterase domain-containing protein 1 n=1 Tax=Monocercomonoides exilis TaxID=2049356 RepID=UPI00355A749D|nr:putative metallophosphoesterase domain-containing protein 1 [Monocercomonoides exilis]|eukprot:MONOS_2755.1-p1 / transcript=MONOS_2755.1 / gene=MONOS_2755 / organism=Monocercomonoides_exilis_PA203 / gene_product=metallophosphoesterase domain-containing protein 1 / transcript_product=metallophosphoesterase domain-containing protein 1 / location=Mono_scaffold00058:151491-152471(-) / protein_length=326 / sequence_SO=supercontig / SO=protein_coding / is_pseudo=false